MSKCSDPVQRLFVTSAHAKVLLLEATSGRFPARPARFDLPRRLTNLGGCCEMPTGRGAELLFRDHGRKFYAFVYVGVRSGARQDAVALLNSLRIAPP